ncbi:MAG: potassium transporter TrkA [Acidobacteria bacterium]|nr:MAG: potassium transporter TrkA [Acidobacteriota bacterium]
MHAVIVGCGRVGAELADALGERGYTVSIIDKDFAAFERLPSGFGGKTLVGPGFERSILEDAGIKNAEIFIAVTNGDNSNIVSARVAKEYYKVPKVAARIYDPRRAVIYERLGISTVAIVAWTTDQILSKVFPSAESIEWTPGSGEVVVLGIPAPDSMIGRPASELEIESKLSVVSVTRNGSTMIPNAKTYLQEGDFIHVAALRSMLGELDEMLFGGSAK